jgi:hypothetical protein
VGGQLDEAELPRIFIMGAKVANLCKTGSVYVDSFEDLLEAYELIGEQLPLLLEREALFRHHPYMAKALESIYMDILEFHQQALRFFSGNSQYIDSSCYEADTSFNRVKEHDQMHVERL